MENNTQKLLGICSEILEIEVTELSLETSRLVMEEWDSLAHIRLIAEMEEIFNCEIPIDSITEIEKISDFLQYIR